VATREEFLEEVERDQKPGGKVLVRVVRVEFELELSKLGVGSFGFSCVLVGGGGRLGVAVHGGVE